MEAVWPTVFQIVSGPGGVIALMLMVASAVAVGQLFLAREVHYRDRIIDQQAATIRAQQEMAERQLAATEKQQALFEQALGMIRELRPALGPGPASAASP